MNYINGSSWRKWDFHVHTPYSILNNEFGFNPYELKDEDLEREFDKYVQELFSRAIEADVYAIGITDYFSIDGYRKITEDYLQNQPKMEKLFPDERVRNRIDEIFVFPNIELRIDTFVGNNSVNYHVIFSPSVSPTDIQDNFLHCLTYSTNPNERMPITSGNIKSLGMRTKEENHVGGSDYLVGLQKLTVSWEDIWNASEKFKGKRLISIPVDEVLSDISWEGRDSTTRKNLYRQCDCYMTSNPNTRKWALAEGEEEERKQEFGGIKPCIWGSDAHSYEKMFRPAEDRFCWVKADTSFDGLLQILYEPAERVTIQKDCPCEKDAHQVIRSVTIDSPDFQTEPIVFNESLTCIIGGKSTGKSTLLGILANAIDPQLVKSQMGNVSRDINWQKLDSIKATVEWADGTSEQRKIAYIPQTFLNRTIDIRGKDTEINKIIEKLLLQEPEIKHAKDKLLDEINQIKSQTVSKIADYCASFDKLKSLDAQIREHGSSEVFSKTISVLESERDELVKKNDITVDEIDHYRELEAQISDSQEKKAAYDAERSRIEGLPAPKVVIPGYFSYADGCALELHSEDFPYTAETIEKTISDLDDMILTEWQKTKNAMLQDLSEKIKGAEENLSRIGEEYGNLKAKVEQNEQIQKLSKRITEEKGKLAVAKHFESEKKKCCTELDDLKGNIISSRQRFKSAYEHYCNYVEKTGIEKNTNLQFEAEVIWRQQDFQLRFNEIFDNRNYSTFKTRHNYDLAEISEEYYGNDFLRTIWDAMMMTSSESGSLTIKSSHRLEEILQVLFDNWYIVHYDVKSGNDTIQEMSPGKKASVLLEMLINLEDSKCPILIDQPEDDLDNRSIYDDLVRFIRFKKKERQIIVVTHNSNVVLGADAEEVIIANQSGVNAQNESKRFEYRSGSIENDELGMDKNGIGKDGILNSKGIQTQICDILEGGKQAFELRQNKYTAVTD